MSQYDHPQYPTDIGSKRYWCHPDHPMPANAPSWTRWRHQRVKEIGAQEGGWPNGDWIKCKCLDCGQTWDEELPQ